MTKQINFDAIVEEEKPKPKRRTAKKKAEPKPKASYPEFGVRIDDKSYDIETSLTLCSNNGSDKKKTLHHARSKRVQRPILLEIDCEVPSYNVKNFSLTVDEAKKMVDEMQRMIEYLEET